MCDRWRVFAGAQKPLRDDGSVRRGGGWHCGKVAAVPGTFPKGYGVAVQLEVKVGCDSSRKRSWIDVSHWSGKHALVRRLAKQSRKVALGQDGGEGTSTDKGNGVRRSAHVSMQNRKISSRATVHR